MATYFTADTHLNHDNIREYCSRPFGSLHDMTNAIIDHWNAVVHYGDLIYHLGDFALSWGKRNATLIDTLLRRLNGNKWLIIGNHDRREVRKNPRWNKVAHYHELKVDMGGPHRQRIVLSHYPLQSWNQMHRGAWMLHGHCHGTLEDTGGKIMDVGVDCHGYRPVGLGEVTEYMAGREGVVRDYRGR
jgi:calcineurin-like phosphoesterase family protein